MSPSSQSIGRRSTRLPRHVLTHHRRPRARAVVPLLATAALLLVACTVAPSSSPSGTSSPSSPAPGLSSVSTTASPTASPSPTTSPTGTGTRPSRLVVLARATGALSWLMLPLSADPRARVDGLRSTGGVVAGTAYAITSKDTRDVVGSLTADGNVAQVAKVVDPSSLTVDADRGLLTWSAPSSRTTAWSSLVLAMPATGGAVTRLATFGQPIRTNRAAQVGRWSRDGRRLYLGEDPVGIGGYDGYFGDGVSSLLVLDTTTGRLTRLVPFTTAGLCLDDLSPGQRRLVDTCRRAVRVRDLSTGATTVISAPAGSSAYRLLRSARFSPDGSRVAYALLKANPDAEQGAVAVSDSLRGSSRIVATFARSTVSVDGWITSTTLLVESMQVNGCTSWCTSTWLVDVTSGHRTRLTTGDATVVAIDPGRVGG